MKKIPYGHQSINQDDIDAVVSVLKSDWLTQGPTISEFEKALAQYCEAPHACAVANGTVALQLAAMALGLGPGKKYWTTPLTFAATANAALYTGATVDFVDIDPESRNISVSALHTKLKETPKNNRPTVVAPVHFSGAPCDMKSIHELAKEFDFRVLEDGCHALGAKHDGKPVGACTYSDATVFSFHPVKSITTGEGGAIITPKSEVHDSLNILRTHGIERTGKWKPEQKYLGLNGRMTDMQAALGLSQLKRLDSFIAKRNHRAKRYYELLGKLPIRLPKYVETSAWHLFAIEIDPAKRESVLTLLKESGIEANVHYIPVHLQPYYQKLGFRQGQFPNAEKYFAGAITLPLYPDLSDEEQEYVASTLRRLL